MQKDDAGRGDLPAPAVPPDLYDDEYYRSICAGATEWESSAGARYAGIYPASLQRAGLRSGETLVDLGTGRGELLAAAVRMGAARAVGVEYSPSAVALANQTLRQHRVTDRAEVVLADARQVPLPAGAADLVTMLDVVEHLTPDELAGALSQARRLLRPGGRVSIHTFPTRTVYEVTYRWQRSLRRSRRDSWPADPRGAVEKAMHVNEQTARSLRAALRGAGFEAVRVRHGDWVYADFVPDPRARRTYRWLARFPLTRPLGAADLWGNARVPG